MRARLLVLALAAVAACRTAPVPVSEAHASEPKEEPAPGVAVVELFTSEGCSSCPPADRLLGELAASSPDRVYALSFHVDYWDDLGWPDRFASSAYTDRQQTYARLLGVRGLYTPQIVVNGAEELIGSDRDRAAAAIARALATPARLRLVLHPRWTAPNVVTVDSEASGLADGASLFLALVERQAVTSVPRGENAGKTLRHENVVRSLASVPFVTARGSVVVRVPSSLVPAGAELIGWVQHAPTLAQGMPVLGAARASLPEP